MNANHTLHAVFKQLSSGHDVTIKGITSKTVVGQGHFVTIKVTAMDIGSYTETFNVTSYVNATPIASRLVTLESGTGITLTFTWNTTGYAKGNYTINAEADSVTGEVNTDDNNVNGWVIVAMVGDITGPDSWPDGKVDIRDIATVAILFGVKYPDPRYDSNSDLTGPTSGVADGKIDIRDIATIAIHFGEIDP